MKECLVFNQEVGASNPLARPLLSPSANLSYMTSSCEYGSLFCSPRSPNRTAFAQPLVGAEPCAPPVVHRHAGICGPVSELPTIRKLWTDLRGIRSNAHSTMEQRTGYRQYIWYWHNRDDLHLTPRPLHDLHGAEIFLHGLKRRCILLRALPMPVRILLHELDGEKAPTDQTRIVV